MSCNFDKPKVIFFFLSLPKKGETLKLSNPLNYLLLTILSCLNFSVLEAQFQPNVDFQKVEAFVKVIPETKTVVGKATYSLQILKDTTEFFLDAKSMTYSIEDLPRRTKVTYHDEKLHFKGKFKAEKEIVFTIEYEMQPKQTLYFYGFNHDEGDDQIWTQGQGKYTSHWLPSLDNPRDKMVFELSVESPKNLQAVANGKFIRKIERDSTSLWQFQMKKPMSSYLLAFAVGDYAHERVYSSSGIPLHLYMQRKDMSFFEATYRYSQEMFDFLENEIGVPYPWEVYQQIPVRDFLYSGMENTTLTIFSDNFIVDETGFVDHNYISVNAHELAHQWFGNLVTAESDEHHWLQEGFATYYGLLAEREIFGEPHFYRSLYESAEQLKALSDKGKGEAILRTKASSLTYYQKGAWALHILSEKMGEEKFRLAVRNYLEKYQYSTANTDQFLAEVAEVSSVDIAAFKLDWLQQSAFQAEEALESLKKSLFIKQYLELLAVRERPLEQKREHLVRFMKDDFSRDMNQEAVFQIGAPTSKVAIDLYKQALRSKSIYTKQAVAIFLDDIPQELRLDYEQLLLVPSYITVEKALYHLWANFPEQRHVYLDVTREMKGFRENNIRQLWLLLALVTPDFEPKNKQKYFTELTKYTSSANDFNTRKIAFNYLYQLDVFSDEAYLSLIESCFHPTWVYRDFCRAMLKDLLSEEKHQTKVKALVEDLSEAEKEYLNTLLQ